MLHKGFLAMLHETDSHVQMKPKSGANAEGQYTRKPEDACGREIFLRR
jgi:hypothetical protein